MVRLPPTFLFFFPSLFYFLPPSLSPFLPLLPFLSSKLFPTSLLGFCSPAFSLLSVSLHTLSLSASLRASPPPLYPSSPHSTDPHFPSPLCCFFSIVVSAGSGSVSCFPSFISSLCLSWAGQVWPLAPDSLSSDSAPVPCPDQPHQPAAAPQEH